MRILLASTALTLALAAPGLAATLDLGALNLAQGTSLTENQRMDVNLDTDFGFYSANSVSDNPTIQFSTDALSLTGLKASDIKLSYTPKPGNASVKTLEAIGSLWASDTMGAALLFDVTQTGDLTPDLSVGDQLYVVINGDFTDYAQGYYTNQNVYSSVYRVTSAPAPVPLPMSAPLLLAGLAAFGLVRRR